MHHSRITTNLTCKETQISLKILFSHGSEINIEFSFELVPKTESPENYCKQNVSNFRIFNIEYNEKQDKKVSNFFFMYLYK